MRIVLSFLLLLLPTTLFSQQKTIAKLPIVLNEVSGMLFINDTTLLVHNDSEKPTRLYLINLKGEIQNTIQLDFSLRDFEAIVKKGDTLYLGDIGNNRNKRRDLKILTYDLKRQTILSIDTISYPEQHSFPPKNDSLYFDAEAMTFKNDSLLIFTKNRTKPFNGISFIYYYDLHSKQMKLIHQLQLKKIGWLWNSVTDVAFYKDKFYILTYKSIYVFDSNFNQVKRHIFGRILQREAIAINSKNEIYIVTEKNKYLGGGKLYRVDFIADGHKESTENAEK